MKTVKLTNELACSADTFWALFFDEAFLRALFVDEMQFKEYTILEQTATGRKARVVPKINLPGALQKLVGDSFSYEEHGTLDRARNEWSWRMVPKKELLTMRGTMRLEPIDDRRCRRIDEVTIEGKIFGLGGLIESTSEKEVRAATAKEVAFVARWMERQKSA